MRPPILVGELELASSFRAIELPARDDGDPYTAVRLLVRIHREPVGYAFLAPDALDAVSVAEQVWRQLGPAINARRERDGRPALDALPPDGIPAAEGAPPDSQDAPPVSVVVCTRDRPDGALSTLRGLMASRYPRFEVVLVDNAPSSDATKDAVLGEFATDARIRYVREPRPGLSCARNRGVAESTAEIIAFTDDDVRVDPWWLHGIIRGFGRAGDVACVTGLIPTAALDNAVQLYFDQRQRWGAFSEPRIFDLKDNRDDSPLYPYSAGIFGAGANFAISRRALKELGGFDEALGAGTPSGGGEDLDVFVRTVLSGHRLVYEPSAIIWHDHRANLQDLSRQMLAYGSGCTAALTALLLRSGKARRELPAKIVAGAIRVSAIGDRTKDNPVLPAGLAKRVFHGMAVGPWLYFKSRRQLRREAASRSAAAGSSSA